MRYVVRAAGDVTGAKRGCWFGLSLNAESKCSSVTLEVDELYVEIIGARNVNKHSYVESHGVIYNGSNGYGYGQDCEKLIFVCSKDIHPL
jgi:hypothetical protein